MGACATKPKVLKADSGEAPAALPEPAPEEEAAGGGAVVESKVENGSEATETGDDDKVDSKSRSLSNLLNNQNEGKDSNENEKAAPDTSEKQEPPPETEKQITNPLELEQKTSVSDAIDDTNEDKVVAVVEETAKTIETPSEEKIKVEVTNENDPTESSEKPTESEKEEKVSGGEEKK